MMSEVSPRVRKRWLETAANEYVFCGLMTAEPASFSTVSEATGGSRQSIQWAPVESAGFVRNANPLIFDKLDWGQRISHIALFNGQGDMGFWGALLQPTVIEKGTLSLEGAMDDYTRMGSGTFRIEALDIGIRLD